MTIFRLLNDYDIYKSLELSLESINLKKFDYMLRLTFYV